MPLFGLLASLIWLAICYIALIAVILFIQYVVCPAPRRTEDRRGEPAEYEFGITDADPIELEAAEDALVKLGYKRTQARRLVRQAVEQTGAADAESILDAIVQGGMLGETR